MAALFVSLIIIGCAAYQYKNGTLVKAFASVIVAVCASIVAFSYFEVVADLLISRDILVSWAQPTSFVLLFVLTFAILTTIAAQLIREPVNLGLWPEHIGRVINGLVLGIIISGTLLAAFAMAPVSSKYPYQRFDPDNPNPQNPQKLFPNADGFVTELFNMLSSGTFSGKRSFAVLHADFIDQAFLNRLLATKKVSILTTSAVIDVPKKNAAKPLTHPIKDAQNPDKTVEPKVGCKFMVLQMKIKPKVFEDSVYTLSQVRLLCKPTEQIQEPLAGKAKNIYPIGLLVTDENLQRKGLNEPITPSAVATKHNGSEKEPQKKKEWLNLVFEVPNDYAPVLIEFKQNNILFLSSGKNTK